jgi:hypothetical protein
VIIEGPKIDANAIAEIVARLRECADKIEGGVITLQGVCFTRVGITVDFDRNMEYPIPALTAGLIDADLITT